MAIFVRDPVYKMKKTLQVLNALIIEGVVSDYAIGGAMGATFYLDPVMTIDLDIFVLSLDKFDLSPLQPIYKALKAKGYLPDEQEKECVNIEGVPVRFLPAYNALLEEACQSALISDYAGIKTKVISAEHLVAISLQTGRIKDKLRVLAFKEAEILDAEKLEDILSRHGLMEKWRQWTNP